jgi:Zn-dependent protease with chaperone function
VAHTALPYPPSPDTYPDELVAIGREGTSRALLLLAGVFAFLMLYVGLIIGCLAVVLLMMTSLHTLPYPLLWIIASVFCAGFALLLIKGLFPRRSVERTTQVEIFEDEHPKFFAFIERITEEIGAPAPRKVFVSADVNAAAIPETSLLNLIVPPKKDLLIGLGLVNSLNLSEFKAVVAHEFGHFSQKTSRVNSYVYIAFRVMDNLIAGEDWLDRMIRTAHRAHASGLGNVFTVAFLACVGGPIWLTRKAVAGMFYVLHLAHLSLSRQNEFHADRIAVSVAGSNAVVHCLLRCAFGNEVFNQAADDLETASQHKLYTSDLFHHQTAAAERVRRTKRTPRLGLPPALKRPEDGRDVQVFDEDDDTGVPEMWSTHPSNYDREENAKAIFIPAVDDERSPWILFSDVEDLKERVTYKFYRLAFGVTKSVTLSSAARVQEFIDDEYAEITYDPRYHGAYDDRWIEPGKVADLDQVAESEPWDAQRIARVHGRLYLELGRRAEDLAAVKKAARKILRRNFGRRPRGRDRRELDDLEDEFKSLGEWFESFDRRVYLVHANMAEQVDPDRRKELSHRYDFHLALQYIQRQMSETHDAVGDVLAGREHYGEVLPPDFFDVFHGTLRNARKTLKHCLRLAEGLKAPAMANIPAGTRCDDLIFDANLLREAPETYVRGEWIAKLLEQMGRMHRRADRLVFKSMGAILQMQDRLAADWYGKAIPAAVLLQDEALPELIVVEEDRPRNPKPS